MTRLAIGATTLYRYLLICPAKPSAALHRLAWRNVFASRATASDIAVLLAGGGA